MSSTSCDRFEREGLARLEAGQPPDEHELDCADCADARRRYERLCLALSELPPVKAPAGWEQKVFAALPDNDAGPAPEPEPEPESGQAVVNKSPPYVTWLPWVGLAAAAAAVFIFVKTREPPAKALAVRQEVVASASGRRADSATVGDTLRITTQGGTGSVRELRLYRDTRSLVARCPDAAGKGEANSNAGSSANCTVEAGSPTLTFPLSVAGSYRSLIIVGSQQAPEPSGSLDEDARAAAAAGAEVEMSLAVEVQ